METDKIYNLTRAAYFWGRDNGKGISDKNFNDFLETTLAKEVFEEKPLFEGEYFMVKIDEDETFVPAICFYNMIEKEKYFKFFDCSEIPCRLVFKYYGI